MPLVKNAGKRHRIIDALLSGKRRLLTRDEFLEMINRKLDPDEQITVHTLDKDIKDIKEKIQDRGVDIRRTHIRGYHYTREGFSLYKNEVNEDDKNLLLLASSVFSLFNGTPIQDKFGQLVEKVLSESMIAGRAGELSQQQLVELGAGPPVKGSQWISPLLDAILKKETLEMVYKSSFKNAKKKHICPYLIKKYQHRWFLIAYDHNCERADKTNTFALDCIESLDISNKAYISDPDFKPEDFFRYTIGIWHYHRASPIKVQLEFTGYINEIMSAPLHHSQKTILSDDLKKLQVEIEVYHSPELKTLILGYGAAVRVLNPRELANEIAHEAGKIGNSYH